MTLKLLLGRAKSRRAQGVSEMLGVLCSGIKQEIITSVILNLG